MKDKKSPAKTPREIIMVSLGFGGLGRIALQLGVPDLIGYTFQEVEVLSPRAN